MESIVILIIGMGLVTYIPRMLPLVFLKDLRLPARLKRFFDFIPFAILGALIFPGILYSTDSSGSAIFGGIVAVIVAFFRVNLVFVVISGILGAYIWSLFF